MTMITNKNYSNFIVLYFSHIDNNLSKIFENISGMILLCNY